MTARKPGKPPGLPKTGGRKPGTPNKKTQALIDRLEELGCDPLELSAKIALGQELDGPHPALKHFYAFRDKLAKLEDKGGAITPDHLEELTALIDDHLTRGYVPYDLRSKHIADLMQYAHPKRKAIEVSGELEHKQPPKIDPRRLSNQALAELLEARTEDGEEA